MAIKISWREHREKSGAVVLYARFKIPLRTDGKIEWKYTERSTRTGKRVEARDAAERIYQGAYTKAHAPVEGEASNDSFAAAALSYMKNKGSKTTPIDGLISKSRLKVRANKKYLAPVIERIGTKKLPEIDQTLMGQLMQDIYPGRTAATINRQLFTPVIAVLKFAGREDHKLKRPEGHDSVPALDVPTDAWYPAVLRAANPWARAFLIADRLCGRRPDELLNRTRDHFSAELGTLAIWDGKGEQWIVLQLPEPALIAIRALPDLRLAKKHTADARLTRAKQNFLFGTNQASTMRKWLKDACKEAGVRYHMPKEAGRHAWATGHLAAGKSLKWVMDGQRWKTIKMPAEKYGHLELQEVDRQARSAGEEWFRKMLAQPVVIEGPERTSIGDVVGGGQKCA